MSTMPSKERVKLQALIEKIEEGDFTANDIDSLLIKVRPYAMLDSVIRELADFVAHADARNKGIACNALTGYTDGMKFWTEYTRKDISLDITKPFPAYIFRLMKYQARRLDAKELKSKFRMSPESLISKIESNFQLDKTKKTYAPKDGKVGKELLASLNFAMDTIHANAALKLETIKDELTALLKRLSIKFEKEKLSEQMERIFLAFICLLSGTEFDVSDNGKARCYLGTSEHHFRTLAGE